MLATGTSPERLEEVVADKVFLVQLADFMWREIRSREERIDTARHMRVFPGEGVHSADVGELIRTLDRLGYRGDYSFEVFNDDYSQLPVALVTGRARRSVKWLTDQVSRRSLPLRGAAA
jgi:sugar phosphate isomerase/epimerase